MNKSQISRINAILKLVEEEWSKKEPNTDLDYFALKDIKRIVEE
tara:strand:+ start:937 stop:1068 length:132 start_codon:yes stop_codon:yes gene_type:complete